MSNRFDLLQIAVKGLCIASGSRFLVLTDSSGNPVARSPDCPDWFIARLSDIRSQLEPTGFDDFASRFSGQPPVGVSVAGRVTLWAVFDAGTRADEHQKGLTVACLVIGDLLGRPPDAESEDDTFGTIPPMSGTSGGTPFSPATMYATDWVN